MKKLVLIDGNSLLHRAYHAYPPLTAPSGELINAVYGFSAMLLSILEKLSPTHVAVAWDLAGPTFREKEFVEYKANRGPMDEELASQIDRTKGVVKVLNIPQFGIEGYEADDIIGTLAEKAGKEEGSHVVIVTGDRDSLQLIKDTKIVVFLPIQNHHAQSTVFDEAKVKETYNLTPRQIVDLKSLMGDASDNIPGVKDVGKVTATKLINLFGSLKGIYENIESKEISERIRLMLKGNKETAEKSYYLAEINKNVPVDLDWDACLLTNYDKEEAIALFEELGFKSLIPKLPRDTWEKDVQDIFI